MNNLNNIEKRLEGKGDGEAKKELKKLASKLDDLTPDGLGLEVISNLKAAYRDAVDNGFEGTEEEFIKTIPIDQLRQMLGKGGNVVLISDYLKQKEEPEIKKIDLAQGDFEKTVAGLTDKDRALIRQLLKMSGVKVSD